MSPETSPAEIADAATKPPEKRAMRELFEGLGIALLMAVFYKYFAIEAYQIPTSSMQPTMMGSSEAGVYDRLIVDKLRYTIFEPEQWDIAVFKYPIRQNQNYVKRIVGMPGMRLRFAGGNVYRVIAGDGSLPEHLEVCRKPADLQHYIWKNVFPARMHVNDSTKALNQYLNGRNGTWTETDGVLRCEPRGRNSRTRLTYSRGDRGLINEVWDGYPTDIARTIRESSGGTPVPHQRQVQDLRIAFDLTAEAVPQDVSVAIAMDFDEGDRTTTRRVGARWTTDGIALFIDENQKDLHSTPALEFDFEPGRTYSFRFAHCDDELTLEVDGEQVLDLNAGEYKALADPRLVTPGIRVTTGSPYTIANLRIDRDLHYIASTRVGSPNRNLVIPDPNDVIEVPEGHYMMLGDNTLQSVDSRDWTKITIGVLDGRVVDPKTHPDAKQLAGNLRPVMLSESPDPDENPVVIASKHKVVFTDDAGEVHTLDGTVHLDGSSESQMWGRGAWFQDEAGNPWHPEAALVRFVPREHIIGRPLINFWPIISPFRVGLIR